MECKTSGDSSLHKKRTDVENRRVAIVQQLDDRFPPSDRPYAREIAAQIDEDAYLLEPVSILRYESTRSFPFFSSYRISVGTRVFVYLFQVFVQYPLRISIMKYAARNLGDRSVRAVARNATRASTFLGKGRCVTRHPISCCSFGLLGTRLFRKEHRSL